MARAAGQLGEIRDLGAVAEVGAIHPVAVHRLLVGETGERGLDLDPHRAERPLEEAFGDLDDLFRIGEGHLHVHLGELRLAVGAQILVPEAADDLVVAIRPPDHQQLLEELRRLRERVEAAAMDPGRHQVVPGPFRGGPGQKRSLDFEEPVFVEVAADLGGQPAADPQVALQPRVPEVQIAVAETEFLRDPLGIGRRERRSPGLAEHVDALRPRPRSSRSECPG